MIPWRDKWTSPAKSHENPKSSVLFAVPDDVVLFGSLFIAFTGQDLVIKKNESSTQLTFHTKKNVKDVWAN